MFNSRFFRICGAAAVLVLFGFVSLSATPISADTKIFEQGGWIVSGATDTAPNARKLRVRVQGQFVGKFSELKIARKTGAGDFPQVFSIKGSGAFRANLPTGEFGGTFYGTGYWDCDAAVGFVQNLFIKALDIRLDTGRILKFQGKASNHDSLRAKAFTVRLSPPKNNRLRARVNYKLVATRALCIDAIRQQNHEGFRIARAASMYVSATTHDSDQARYTDNSQKAVCANLKNENGFIFTNPMPLGQSNLLLVHTTAQPRNTPTLSIEFISPSFSRVTPQGYVTQTDDPDDDNVDLWGNWDAASAQYAAGQVIGNFEYMLEARAPSMAACN